MRRIRVGGFFSGIGAHVSACDRLKDRAEFVRITEAILDDMEDPHADRGGLDYWMGIE